MYNQANWHNDTECGTSMCVAGWACYLQGDQFISFGEIITADGREIDIPLRAAELLGLDPRVAEMLFFDVSPISALDKLRRISEGDDTWHVYAGAAI